ncbi:MAG: zf-TFIIB domain-containing protein [Candidatus Caenarcaniphilales bacterium]|nr:zf-TFIIB domain-containing protein [Candidatus Caenarcaniphilales bacterium]
MMNCPICLKAMIVIERQKIELDYCPFDHGIWFDAEEIDLLQEATGLCPPDWEVEFVPKSIESGRACPRCGQTMYKYICLDPTHPESSQEDPLILDICQERHGVWFDRNELAQFINPNRPETSLIKFLGNLIRK